MSYYETISGTGKRAFSEGMGATFNARGGVPNEELRGIQRDLQYMGLLAPGTGATGADGLWGQRTASALGQARLRLGRTAAPFSVTNGGRNLSIPDDFISAIHAAAMTSSASATPALPPPPDPSTVTRGDLPAVPLPPTVEEIASPSNTRLYLIGGSIAVVGLGVLAYMLWSTKSAGAAPRVTANRRKRRR